MNNIFKKIQDRNPEQKNYIAQILAFGVTALIAAVYIIVRVSFPALNQKGQTQGFFSGAHQIIQTGVDNFSNTKDNEGLKNNGWLSLFGNLENNAEYTDSTAVNNQDTTTENSLEESYDESLPYTENTDELESQTLFQNNGTLFEVNSENNTETPLNQENFNIQNNTETEAQGYTDSETAVSY